MMRAMRKYLPLAVVTALALVGVALARSTTTPLPSLPPEASSESSGANANDWTSAR